MEELVAADGAAELDDPGAEVEYGDEAGRGESPEPGAVRSGARGPGA